MKNFVLNTWSNLKNWFAAPMFAKEDNHYWDDPIRDVKDRSAEALGALLMVIIVLLSFEIKAVWAANINLNSGINSEFGQGITQTVSCSGNTQLLLTPQATFVNASGLGSYMLGGITVSNIPSGCSGLDFKLNVFDNSSNTPIALYGSTVDNVLVYDNSGSFYLDPAVTGATITTNSTSSFTVTFTNPVGLTSSTAKLAIQSMANSITLSCVTLGNCTVGSTGPGNGTIFYYASGGFNCGTSFNSTGSPTGGLCHYLEAATGTWYTSVNNYNTPYDNSAVFLCANATNGQLDPSNFTPTLSNSLGAGRKNTVLGSAYCANGALKIATLYSGGNLTDWYMPNATEINTMESYFANANKLSTAFINTTGTWYWTSDTMAYSGGYEILASQAGFNPSWVSGASAYNHQKGHLVVIRAF